MADTNVVVGIDFSEPAGRALNEARIIADCLKASLDLVHVSTGTPEAGWRPGAAEAAWLAVHGLDADRVTVRFGTPWVELSRHGAERESALIAVGSHGSAGYQSMALGSTAARLTLAATRPVLVVSPWPRRRRFSWLDAEPAPIFTDGRQRDFIPGADVPPLAAPAGSGNEGVETK